MLFNVVFLCSTALAVSAAGNEWKAPTSSDRRSPCPMVNSLANHGYLPRNGLNISLDDLIVAFTDSVNLDPAATTLVGKQALTTGDGVTFNLDDLNKHGIIEHDGSLSRADTFFGDNHSFNETIWAQTSSHFTESTISIRTAAKARNERLKIAAATNPEYDLPSSGNQASLIETALYLIVFGNPKDGNAKTEWVKTLFEQERLPFEEGFKRSEEKITVAGILGMVAKVVIGASSAAIYCAVPLMPSASAITIFIFGLSAFNHGVGNLISPQKALAVKQLPESALPALNGFSVAIIGIGIYYMLAAYQDNHTFFALTLARFISARIFWVQGPAWRVIATWEAVSAGLTAAALVGEAFFA
ncbi:hypothetical protein FLONG3_4864 [Fusarium longipes]|uniref:Heme haloperoxidase family profile domain-containing protein n=1 Tax=Fusarium longipes TaxID=694270 RepID=A0A395SYI7_9HYPO|nr:hypothetical protein FLONG3_4864 [Fusarium longipes]